MINVVGAAPDASEPCAVPRRERAELRELRRSEEVQVGRTPGARRSAGKDSHGDRPLGRCAVARGGPETRDPLCSDGVPSQGQNGGPPERLRRALLHVRCRAVEKLAGPQRGAIDVGLTLEMEIGPIDRLGTLTQLLKEPGQAGLELRRGEHEKREWIVAQGIEQEVLRRSGEPRRTVRLRRGESRRDTLRHRKIRTARRVSGAPARGRRPEHAVRKQPAPRAVPKFRPREGLLRRGCRRKSRRALERRRGLP